MSLISSRFRPRLWRLCVLAVLIALIAAFNVIIVRTFVPLPEHEADVAQDWNTSLSRLGIIPVYPPVEDLHVGDLWAIVTADNPDEPLLRKSVRLTHVDLRDEMRQEYSRQPVFADTITRENGEAAAQPSAEVPGDRPADLISLTLTSFPGISIRHERSAAGSFSSQLFGLNTAREATELEEIRIPVAESYGVNAASAIARLTIWCKEPDTKIYCSGGFVRRVFAFAVSDEILTKRDGRFVFQLQLCLVTRVFLMREIEFRHTRAGSTNTRASVDAAGASQSIGAISEAGELGQERKTAVGLRQVFQRPLAFGFRSINVSLKDPSQ